MSLPAWPNWTAEQWREATKNFPVQKWDERKHPRDKEGQFAPVESRQPGEDPDDMEGAGPERKKWSDINVKAIAAQDVYIDELTRHRDLVKALNKKYNVDTPLNYPEEGYKEYRASQTRRDDAASESTKYEVLLKEQTPRMKIEVVSNLAIEEAQKLGVNQWHIHVVDKEPPEFMVGDKKFTEGGHYQPWDDQIEINVRSLSYGDAPGVRGLVDHELSHFVYHSVKMMADREFAQYIAKAIDDKDQYTPWYHERFTEYPSTMGMPSFKAVKPEFRAEMVKEFPATAALSHLSGGTTYMFQGISEKMVKENGHSAYAKSYWQPAAIQSKGGYESAINETVAEVTRYLNQPNSWRSEADKPDPQSPWVTFTKEMHRAYREHQARLRAKAIGDALSGKL